MKISNFKSYIVPVLLTAFVCLLFANFIMSSRAQAPLVGKGFWFWQKPSVPQSMKDATRSYVETYLERLKLLATIPVGNTGMADAAGNAVTWDQVMIDAINAEIVAMEQILTDLPE